MSAGLLISHFISNPRAQLSYEYLFTVRGQKLQVLIYLSNNVAMTFSKKKLFFFSTVNFKSKPKQCSVCATTSRCCCPPSQKSFSSAHVTNFLFPLTPELVVVQAMQRLPSSSGDVLVIIARESIGAESLSSLRGAISFIVLSSKKFWKSSEWFLKLWGKGRKTNKASRSVIFVSLKFSSVIQVLFQERKQETFSCLKYRVQALTKCLSCEDLHI